jgi:hypothetical protein
MSAIVTPTSAQIAQNSPPITQLIPLISKTWTFLVAAASYLIHAFIFLASWISYPMLVIVKAPLPFILYILSPVIVFGQILFGGLFIFPYNAIVEFFVELQPFYVFCGVACISGAVIGMGGRLVAESISAAIMENGRVGDRTSAQASLEGKSRKRTMW